MAALVARLPSLEARTIAIVPRPRRKSKSWVCGECGVKRASTLTGITNGNTHDGMLLDTQKRRERPWRSSLATMYSNKRPEPRTPGHSRIAPYRDRDASFSLAEPADMRLWRLLRQRSTGQVDRRVRRKRAPGLWRHVSNSATIDELHQLFEEDELDAATPTAAPQLIPEMKKMIENIGSAVRQGAADWLLKILSPALLEAKNMALIEDDNFTEILALWCSRDHFENLIDHHLAITDTGAKVMRLTPMQDIIEQYLSVVTNIAYVRRKSGCRLSQEQYQHLLNAAHITGSGTVAHFYWDWMSQDQVTPDANCYANYLGANVWNDMLPAYRERSHLTPFNLMARESPHAGRPFDNYQIRHGGIKQFVTQIFSALTRDSVQTNEDHICHVMVGLAREGDVKGVQKMLLRTWGVDVASIMADNDNPPSKRLSQDSPLKPTERLLTTIAFCYGINSDLPTALRVVDYVSRHYTLTTSPAVWKLLVNWAYVLSYYRRARSDFQSTLDPQAVISIWETMQAPPYEIVPSLDMFDKLVRTLGATQHAGDMFTVMTAGMEQRQADKQAVAAAQAELESLITSETASGPKDNQGAIERAQRSFESAILAAQRSAKYLKSWTRLFLMVTDLVAKSGPGNSLAEQVCYRDAPKLLGSAWRPFTEREIAYDLPTGHLQIKSLRGWQVKKMHERLREQTEARKDLLDANVRALGHEWVVKEFRSRRLDRAEGRA
ncbi:hypothetical protein ANO11243_070540 [Dothideomycetidae sp. 11243]|nr:hypothetical protein ANO11243_070540 [fungal sp. No.11243]